MSSDARLQRLLKLVNPGEPRAAARHELRLSALCQWGIEEPIAAELVNVSLSGALLDSPALQVLPSVRPRRGSILKVQVQLPDSSMIIELTGSVARHTPTGVAIQFLRLPTELRELLGQPEASTLSIPAESISER